MADEIVVTLTRFEAEGLANFTGQTWVATKETDAAIERAYEKLRTALETAPSQTGED